VSVKPDQFKEGVIREGCEQLGVALKDIPLVANYSWQGTNFRFWSARFSIKCDSPMAWAIVGRLAYALNSSVLEHWGRQPFVFKPQGEETNGCDSKKNQLYWTIESTEPMLDPKEVVAHLEMILLSQIKTEADWVNY